jgi:hypothetical protein
VRGLHRSLGDNKIGDAGAVALAKALETNSTVIAIEYVACVVRVRSIALLDSRLGRTAV